MALTFETFDIPQSTKEIHISDEEITKIRKRISKIDTNLKKAMRIIARKEYEALKNAYNIVRK